MIEWWWIPLSFFIYYFIGVIILFIAMIVSQSMEEFGLIFLVSPAWPLFIIDTIHQNFKRFFKWYNDKLYRYRATPTYSNVPISEKWCRDNLKANTWKYVNTDDNTVFLFKKKSDYCLFLFKCM